MTWTVGQGVDFTLEHRERATKQDRSQLMDVARFFGAGKQLDNIATSDVDRYVKHCRDKGCLLYTSPSPRDGLLSRMPSSA